MIKCVYAHTGFSSTYPSYVNVSAEGDETCGLKIIVRDHARLVQTENGSHMDAGFTAETLLTPENAMDLARSIFKHYRAESSAFGYPLAKEGEDGIGHEARVQFFPDDHLPGETHRTYEETETVGELSHTRRLVIDSIDSDPLSAQVATLASFILKNFDGEPSEDAGAVDTAIRLLGDYAALLNAQKAFDEGRSRASAAKIAEGLRAGQAERSDLETGDKTYAPFGFVDVGTQAEAVDPFEAPRPPLVIHADHVDGSNEPSKVSSPLAMRVFPDERGYDVVTAQPGDEDATPIMPDVPVADDEIPF